MSPAVNARQFDLHFKRKEWKLTLCYAMKSFDAPTDLHSVFIGKRMSVNRSGGNMLCHSIPFLVSEQPKPFDGVSDRRLPTSVKKHLFLKKKENKDQNQLVSIARVCTCWKIAGRRGVCEQLAHKGVEDLWTQPRYQPYQTAREV